MQKIAAVLTLITFLVVLLSFSRINNLKQGDYYKLNLRTRYELVKGSNLWITRNYNEYILTNETAIIIIDMWDDHWCPSAVKRSELFIPRLNQVNYFVRIVGTKIIHAPGGVINFYKNTIYRNNVLSIPKYKFPVFKNISKLPDFPVVSGCDPGYQHYDAWTRQHPKIIMKQNDVVSVSAREIYNFFKYYGIKNVLITGVHTNVCVINVEAGIDQMLKYDEFKVILVRDLTDSFYSPESKPYVSNEKANELVIEHIEKYRVPTILSEDLLTIYTI